MASKPVLVQRVLGRVLPWTEYFGGQNYLTSYSPQGHKEQLSSVKQLSMHKIYREMNSSTAGQTRNDITTLIFVCVCVCVCVCWSGLPGGGSDGKESV